VSESKDGAKKDQTITADEAATTPDTGDVGEPGDGPTDPRERFREALERKNSSPGTHPGSQSNPGSRLKGSNGKTKRQFRRKSG
jgi:Family of unknown function (DUF5302)